MKKLSIAAVTVVAALGITSSAMADTYSVKGSSITPAQSGTKTKPKPVFGKTIFNITPASATVRPGVIRTYQIGLGEGIVENTALFKTCTAAQITDPNKGPKSCPAESKLNSSPTDGAFNRFGATSNPSSISECDLKLTLFNGGSHKVNLVVQSDPAFKCDLTINPTVVPGVFKKVGGVLNLVITVPPALLHPIPGFDNALYKTTVAKFGKTKRIKGKTRGILESISCPKSHKRTLKTTFITEGGVKNTAKTTSACKS